MTVVEVADGAWVASAPMEGVSPSSHPADLAASAAMIPRRAGEFLAGRGLLRVVLERVGPCAASAVVAARADGKPYLREHAGVGISVSHDGGMAAVCVAVGKEVGVDIQHPDEVVRTGLLRRCLGRHADAVTALSTQDAATELAWVWSVQESCVKATGAGLAGRPWTIDVPPGRLSGRWHSGRWISLRGHSPIPLSCAFSTQGLEPT